MYSDLAELYSCLLTALSPGANIMSIFNLVEKSPRVKFQLYVHDNELEVYVKGYNSGPNSHRYICDNENAAQKLKECLTKKEESHYMTVPFRRSTTSKFVLPEPTISMERRGQRYVAGKSFVPVRGITRDIGRLHIDVRILLGLYTGKRRKSCLQLGNRVDSLLKGYAKGNREALREPTARMIIARLFKEHIVPVDSGVLVTNFQQDARDVYSGTEIDLVGFDLQKRCFVIIEIKVTSKTIQELNTGYLHAPTQRKSGFKRSILGQYYAQLACTASMFRHTYGPIDHYALLMVCANGKVSCVTVPRVDSARFALWLPGFHSSVL